MSTQLDAATQQTTFLGTKLLAKVSTILFFLQNKFYDVDVSWMKSRDASTGISQYDVISNNYIPSTKEKKDVSQYESLID